MAHHGREQGQHQGEAHEQRERAFVLPLSLRQAFTPVVGVQRTGRGQRRHVERSNALALEEDHYRCVVHPRISAEHQFACLSRGRQTPVGHGRVKLTRGFVRYRCDQPSGQGAVDAGVPLEGAVDQLDLL